MGKGKKKDKKKAELEAAEKAAKKEAKKAKKARDEAVEAASGPTGESVRDLLRLPQGPVSLADLDPRATPGFDGDKIAGKEALAQLAEPLADLQERLFADGRAGDNPRAVLLVLQGMDTSGKGGTLDHAVGLVSPQGVQITSFKAPTAEEKEHDFLWRIRRAVPDAGMIGVFDRSHYEDVLIARVRELTTKSAITRRYASINRFEKQLVDSGVVVVKCMLHISADEQKERLLARLDDPNKHWKFNPGDIDERALWPAYQEAYELALEKCNTDVAPWYVIPSDRKWYRNWAVATILREVLEEPGPPVARRGLRRRRAASPPGRGGPARVIPTVSVTRYVTPLREGGSLPGIVEADDLGTYVCKFRSAGQGIRVLAAEVLAAHLVAALDLRTPRLVALELDPEIARYEADEEVQDLLTASAGLNLGVDFLPGSFGFDRREAVTDDVALRVLWLDAFLANVDRSWRNPNLLVWHRDLWLIDHGASLYFHHAWAGGLTDPDRFARQPWSPDDHVSPTSSLGWARWTIPCGCSWARRCSRPQPSRSRTRGSATSPAPHRTRSAPRTSTSCPRGWAVVTGCRGERREPLPVRRPALCPARGPRGVHERRGRAVLRGRLLPRRQVGRGPEPNPGARPRTRSRQGL